MRVNKSDSRSGGRRVLELVLSESNEDVVTLKELDAAAVAVVVVPDSVIVAATSSDPSSTTMAVVFEQSQTRLCSL